MKISKSQLQKIIREEKARVQAKKLNENDMMRLGTAGAAMQTALDEIRQDWYGMYDEGDPSMIGVGLAGWQAQVDSAVESLAEQIVNAFEEVDEGLVNGDYEV
jgi:hypothetical protein